MKLVRTLLKPLVIFRELVRSANNWINGSKDVVKLWVDDLRPAPRGWYWATSVDEAIGILMDCYVDTMSLDHDLGDEGGGDTIKLVQKIVWLQEVAGVKVWPENRPLIHSMNPVGRDNMNALIDRYGPYKENRK